MSDLAASHKARQKWLTRGALAFHRQHLSNLVPFGGELTRSIGLAQLSMFGIGAADRSPDNQLM